MPQLEFFIDDSLEYIDQIEQSLKGEDNPIIDQDLLDKRKKSMFKLKPYLSFQTNELSLYIAKRYLFSKSSNNAINIITIIAAIGVIIGSAALFIVLSGFAGLKRF